MSYLRILLPVFFLMSALFIAYASAANPTHDPPIITPDPAFTTNDLVCTPQNVQDGDGDNVTNITVWKSNTTAGPVLVMSFDSNTSDGEEFRDYSGTGNNGTLFDTGSGAGWTPNGVLGGAFSADGTGNDEFINVPQSASLNLSTFTIELWINRTGSWGSNAEGIISKVEGTSFYRNYLLEGKSNGKVRAHIGNGSVVEFIESTIALNQNEWYHIAMTFDNSTRNMSLYINGSIDITTILDTHTIAASNVLHIGKLNSSTSGRECDCDIDELRIYNYTLSPEQIQNHFNLKYNVTDSTLTSKNQNWTCEVTPNDGTGDGITKFDSILITTECVEVSDVVTLSADTDQCYEFINDDSILDCSDYSLYGTVDIDAQIRSFDRDNITIRNCFIQNASHGISFLNTNNSFILNTTVFNSTDISSGNVEAIGINITNSENNTIHVNITIVNATTTSGSGCYGFTYTYGIHMKNSFNTTIINSTFDDIYGSYRADIDEQVGCQTGVIKMGTSINVDNSDNVTIYNSTVNTVYGGIETDASEYFNISYNTISNSDNYGIRVVISSHYGTIQWNTMINNTNYHILKSSGTDLDVIHNDIRYGEIGIYLTAGSGSFGNINDNILMHLQSSASSTGAIYQGATDIISFDNNTFFNMSFTHPTSAAIYVRRTMTMSNNNITNATQAYVFPSQADDSKIVNDTITNVTNVSYLVAGARNISFFNSTFNKSAIVFAGVGNIHVFYLLRNNVTDENSTPISSASVTVQDSFNSLINSQLTDSNGLTKWIFVEEYNQTSNANYVDGCVGSDSGITCLTPHNITASKSGYASNTSSVTVNQETDFITVLSLAIIRSFQIILEINNTEALVYIPVTGEGEKSSSLLGTGTYTSPLHYYLASYIGNALTGLVASSGTRIFVSNTGTAHKLGIEQDLTPTKKTFLTFTRGDWRNIDNRMSLIKSGIFFDQIKPTFGFGLGFLYPIKIIIQQPGFDIINNHIIQKGRQGMTIAYNGSVNNFPTIVVEKI